MKKIFGSVVLLAVLVLGAYYMMGLATERTLKKNIDIMNQSNGVMIDIDKYNRGWFTSSGVLNGRFRVPERVIKDQDGHSSTIPAEEYTVQVPLSIYHGPFIFADKKVRFGLGYATSQLEIPSAYMAKFSDLMTPDSVKPQLNLSMFVNYLNHSRLNMNMPQFKMIAKGNGDRFEWGGMVSSVSVSSNIRHVEGNLIINGAQIIKNDLKAMLGQLMCEYEFNQTNSGLYLGEASLSLPSFVITENKQTLLNLEKFDVSSSSQINNGLFDSSLKLSLNKMTAKDQIYGPGILEIDLSHLDAQVLADVNQTMNKIQQSTSTDIERQQALMALLPELPKLLAKGAKFEISKLSFVLPQGVIEGHLSLSLPNGSSGNPFQLLQKLVGQANLRVPVSVLRTIELIQVTQKLLSQSSVQQAMIEQLKKNDAIGTTEHSKANEPVNQPSTAPAQASAAEVKNPSAEAAAQHTDAVQPNDQVKGLESAQDIDKQAAEQTDQKLAAMVQSGLLVLQGNEYTIDINLSQGQLSVNGKPFSPSMLQF